MNNQTRPRKYVIRSSQWDIPNEITLNPQNWWFTGINIKDFNHDISVSINEDENVISNMFFLISKKTMSEKKQTNRIRFK